MHAKIKLSFQFRLKFASFAQWCWDLWNEESVSHQISNSKFNLGSQVSNSEINTESCQQLYRQQRKIDRLRFLLEKRDKEVYLLLQKFDDIQGLVGRLLKVKGDNAQLVEGEKNGAASHVSIVSKSSVSDETLQKYSFVCDASLIFETQKFVTSEKIKILSFIHDLETALSRIQECLVISMDRVQGSVNVSHDHLPQLLFSPESGQSPSQQVHAEKPAASSFNTLKTESVGSSGCTLPVEIIQTCLVTLIEISTEMIVQASEINDEYCTVLQLLNDDGKLSHLDQDNSEVNEGGLMRNSVHENQIAREEILACIKRINSNLKLTKHQTHSLRLDNPQR